MTTPKSKRVKGVKAYACVSKMLGLQNMAQIECYSDKKMAKSFKGLGDEVIRVLVTELKPSNDRGR